MRLKTSFDVVTIGPVASAGSMFKRFNAKGTEAPINPEFKMISTTASETTQPSLKSFSQIPTIKPRSMPHINPLKRATLISSQSRFPIFIMLMSPVARPLTATVAAWVPVLPDYDIKKLSEYPGVPAPIS